MYDMLELNMEYEIEKKKQTNLSLKLHHLHTDYFPNLCLLSGNDSKDIYSGQYRENILN